ncbi:D-TA family PLP-dependent enzyme [Stagnihabitans tardus]|uniref:D-TA family PLP-dependent enzyme n=1 Tax=Stagnihabitans tardus TaxID=2699202 RepID=A0AAE4Y817_9RHOB|nr:D-TA family PLP-dependent enzyme [Stagnihabitans tardus]NBZ86874.1 D-TA family PLP-dependent enzyme [Stagnihabitans tardus]
MSIEDIETPAVLVDLTVVEANIHRTQQGFDQLGLGFRPHIKTHKIPYLARQQIQAGAIGIACQKISEAEVFAAEDFDDILLCYNLLSPDKIARARAIAEKTQLSLVADNLEVVAALSEGFRGVDEPLAVLVECDTGAGRCGVQSPQAACDLAVSIALAKGLRFGGLMTYPRADTEDQVESFLSQARDLILKELGACPTISGGGTPSLNHAGRMPCLTEYRAGTYIYNDRSLIARGACLESDCALTVLSTVVSRPTHDRAILDAGSKSLTSDLFGLTGHGLILNYPGAEIVALSEEHAHADFRHCATRPTIGEKLRIIPNHACPVSNLVDQVVFLRGEDVWRPFPVAARGCVI